jgi:uncharacterized membrane protein
MNTQRRLFLAALCLALTAGGCAHHNKKPKPGARIIPEGAPNPRITYAPERAGEVIRDAGPRQ